MQMMFNFTVIRLAFGIGINNSNPITHRGYFCVCKTCRQAGEFPSVQPMHSKEAVPFGITDHCMNITCRKVTKGIDLYTAYQLRKFLHFSYGDDLFRVLLLCRIYADYSVLSIRSLKDYYCTQRMENERAMLNPCNS